MESASDFWPWPAKKSIQNGLVVLETSGRCNRFNDVQVNVLKILIRYPERLKALFRPRLCYCLDGRNHLGLFAEDHANMKNL